MLYQGQAWCGLSLRPCRVWPCPLMWLFLYRMNPTSSKTLRLPAVAQLCPSSRWVLPRADLAPEPTGCWDALCFVWAGQGSKGSRGCKSGAAGHGHDLSLTQGISTWDFGPRFTFLPNERPAEELVVSVVICHTWRPVEGHGSGQDSLQTLLGVLLDKAELQPPAVSRLKLLRRTCLSAQWFVGQSSWGAGNQGQPVIQTQN